MKSSLQPTLLALLALLVSLPTAAQPLSGVVLDTWRGTPVAGARVVDAANGASSETDSEGRFALFLRAGPYQLHVEAEGLEPAWVVGEAFDRPLSVDLLPAGAPSGAPHPLAAGVPPRRPASAPESEPQRLGWPGVLPVGLPEGPLPTSIRVGRRFARSCRNNPVERIDTVDLESYVDGVVRAEIGVFGGLPGGSESAEAVWAAFGIAARSYALWFWARDPDGEFHIDDTACNQVYDDERSDAVNAALERTRGLVMVKDDGSLTIDKMEYAASCGRYGTQPEYDSTLIPDNPGGRGCVGSWCGHDNCAGHAVNPAVPGEGRCLVRGICQWGSAERSLRGDGWEAILAHYQPYVQVIAPGGGPDPGPDPDPEVGALVGFVREGDRAGPGIPGAAVHPLDLVAPLEAATNDQGFYRLDDLPPGELTAVASAPGYYPAQAEAEVRPGAVRWLSFALRPLSEGPPPDAGTVDDLPDTAGGSVTDAGLRDPPGPGGSGGEVDEAKLRGTGACGCGPGTRSLRLPRGLLRR